MRKAAINVTRGVIRFSGSARVSRADASPARTECVLAIADFLCARLIRENLILEKDRFGATPKVRAGLALTCGTRALSSRAGGFRGDLLLYRGFAETAVQILNDLFDQSRVRSRENKHILWAFSAGRKNYQVFG